MKSRTAKPGLHARKRSFTRQLRRMKKATALLLCTTLLLPLLIFPTIAADDTLYGVSVTRNDNDPSKVYYVGESAGFTITVELSGLELGDMLINPVLTLNYSAADITGATVRPTIAASAAPQVMTRSPMVTDAAASTVTWYLTDLAGGTSFSLPCNISMPKDVTPMDYPLVLTATLTSDNKGPVAGTVTIKWQYDKKQPAKVVAQGNYISTLPKVGAMNGYKVVAGNDANGDGRIDADKTEPVIFTFNNNVGAGQGSRTIEEIEIVDTLPPGATFNSAENPGWTDNGNGTVTYRGIDGTVTLKLRFPNGEVGKDYVNNAVYTYKVKSPQFDDPKPEEYRYDLSVYVQLEGQEIPGSIYNKVPIKTTRGSGLSAAANHASRLAMDSEILGDYWFYHSLNSTMKFTELPGVMISDDALDPRLRFFAFNVSIDSRVPDTIIGEAKVQYRVAGQSAWTDFMTITTADFKHTARPTSQLDVITSFTVGSSTHKGAEYCFGSEHANARYTDYYSLPSGVVIDGLRLYIPRMAPGSMVYLDTGARLRDGLAADVDRTDTTSLTNTSGFYYNWDLASGVAKAFGSSQAWHDVIPYQPKFRGMKVLSGTTNKLVGEEITVSNRLRHYDFDADDVIVFEGGQIIDLLPQGISYVPGSMFFTNLNGQTLKDHFDNIEPIVIYDYNHTGQTALIWNLKGDLPASYFKGEYIVYFSYRVKILETCAKGPNTFTGYFHWPEYPRIIGTSNNQSASTPYKGYTPFDDTEDINNNGDKDERFLRCDLTVDYQPPIAVVAQKGVMGSYNSTYLYAPADGYSRANSEASFKLDVVNYSLNALTSFTAFDVLPYVGDKAVVANQTGYVARGTQFDVKLNGAVQVNDPRFEVLYSAVSPEPWEGIDAYETKVADAGGWRSGTQPDWAAVRVFKVVLRSGQTLLPNESVSAVVPVKMPEVREQGFKAYNSFAINSGAGYLEAIKAGIEIVDADVELKKAADFKSRKKDEIVTYTLTVTNRSKVDATETVVTDTIPPGLDFVSCDREGHTIAPAGAGGGSVLTVPLGTLAALQSVSFRVVCEVNGTEPMMNNTATVRIKEPEVNLDNNTDTETVILTGDVHPVGSLTISKKLTGAWENWLTKDNEKDTVYRAKVWDVTETDPSKHNFLLFKSTPEPDGSYWCVTNNVFGEPYLGATISEVPFTVNKPVTLTNLWAESTYWVEEVDDYHFTPVYKTLGSLETDGTFYLAYHDDEAEVEITNDYEHALGDLVISKKLAGGYADRNVSEATEFYAQVRDVTPSAGGPDYGPILLFIQGGSPEEEAGNVAVGPYSYWCVGNMGFLTDPRYNLGNPDEAQIRQMIADKVILDRVPFSADHAAVVRNLWITDMEHNPEYYRVDEIVPAGSPYTVGYIGNNEPGVHDELTFTKLDVYDEKKDEMYDNIRVEVINTYEQATGGLILGKRLAGDYGDYSVTGDTFFHAKIKAGSQYLIFDEANACTGADGIGTAVSFSVNSSATLRNIPVGTVTVEEVTGAGYAASYSAESLPILSGVNAVLTVTNTYELKTGESGQKALIQFNKQVLNYPGGDMAFTFILTEVTDDGGGEVKPGGYEIISTNIIEGPNTIEVPNLAAGTYYFKLSEELEPGWYSEGYAMIFQVVVDGAGAHVTRLTAADAFVNFYAPETYPYKVKYYKDNIANEDNLLYETPWIPGYVEGYTIEEGDVAAALGADWVDAERPEDYREGEVVNYTNIEVAYEGNIVIVLYLPAESYPYRVEYYIDEIEPENIIGDPVGGKTRFARGHQLTPGDVAADLGQDWLDERRPEDYGHGAADYYPEITVDIENNVVRVVYRKTPLYPYTVEYYKDEIGPGNMIGDPVDGVTKYNELYQLTEGDVSGDLTGGWINARRPPGYGPGAVEGYPVITVDVENNVVRVVYKTAVKYPYRVEYYKDSIIPENKIGDPAPGTTEFDEGYPLTAGDVTRDMLSFWINARRPSGYNSGTVGSYPVITVDVDNNVVKVLYVRTPPPTVIPDDTTPYVPDPPPPPPPPPPVITTDPPGDEDTQEDGEPPDDDETEGGRTTQGPPPVEGGYDHDLPPIPHVTGDSIVYVDDEHYLELDEDGVPLGEWRWDEEMEEWIFDEFPPLGSLPQTGAAGITAMALLAACGSSLGFGLSVRRGAKRKSRHTKLR